jgi:hypothetical protein
VGGGSPGGEVLTVDFAPKLEEVFERTGNPVFAWLEVKGRLDSGEPFPAWVNEYFRGCVGRMFDPGAQKSDTREALPRIFGFESGKGKGRGGPLTAPADRERHERFAVAFTALILKGATPKEAREDAYNQCDAEGDADDTTLRRRLKSFFGVEKYPQDNKGWRKVIVNFLLNHPVYNLKYPELPNPFALVAANLDLFQGFHEIRFVDTSGETVPRWPGR